jgi:hypothetical protein
MIIQMKTYINDNQEVITGPPVFLYNYSYCLDELIFGYYPF